MKNRLFTSAVFAAILVLAGARAEAQFRAPEPAVPGENYHVELGLNFWTPAPELIIRTDALSAIGSDVDFVQEFGIEDKRFNEFKATLKPSRKHKVRVQHVPFQYEADAVIERSFVFNGRQYNIGVPATADLEWDLWKFGYEWDIVSTNHGFVGLVTDLKYSRVRAEITSDAIGTEFAEASAPTPGIGGTGRVYVSRIVSVTGEFTAFKVPDSISEQIEGKFVDFDLYGTVNLGRNVGVQAGYRSIDVSYAVDEDAGRLKMKGPYFGGVLRF